jgi:catechol 2,3-dioxygenase-like lactoylglutathione lyase family enzyme
VRKLARIRLNAKDPPALAAFLIRALGFSRADAADGTLRLALGPSRLEIATASGAPYPTDVAVWNPLFQHFAMATRDVAIAYARLCRCTGWRPISTDGPQRLPLSSGGVTAFKFRSPEGHPLELISASAGDRPRIDHSAVSVADSGASADFYGELGLRRGAVSHNRGPEQDRLDALPGAEVEVTALLPSEGATHVELLAYRQRPASMLATVAPGDVAATRLVFAADQPTIDAITARRDRERADPALLLRDPDGHLLQFELARPRGVS